jgi:hypothetical protein
MLKKTYKTYYLKSLQLRLVDKDGRRFEAIFRGGIQPESTAKFTTSDEAMQEAIEKCSGFNRDYYIADVQKKAEKKEVAPKVEDSAPHDDNGNPIVDMKDSKRFQNTVEMKAAMVAAGLSVPDDMTNYQALKALAKGAGYDYQIQK